MAKIIGNLRVNLGLNTANFQAGLGRSQSMMRGFARFARTSALAASAGFAAAAGGLALMTKQGLAFVDQQAKMARTLDGSINGLRALQIAGEDAGVASGVLNSSMQKLTARLAEAARIGGPAALALDEMGLSAKALMKLDADDRLAAIADRAQELGYNAAEAGDILQQFGVRSKEMSLLVIQGGDAIRAARDEVERFGLAISQDQALAVEKANDALARFGRVFEGLRVQLAVNVAPTLERISMRFQEMAVAGGPLQVGITKLAAAFSTLIEQLVNPAFIESAISIGTGLVNAMTAASGAIVTLAENAKITATAMIALGAAMAFFGGPILGAITAVSGAIFLLKGKTSDLAVAAAAARQAESDLGSAMGGVSGQMPGAAAQAVNLAQARLGLAAASLEAAKAELQHRRAVKAAAMAENPNLTTMLSGIYDFTTGSAAGVVDAQIAELDAAQAGLDRVLSRVINADYGGGASPITPSPSTEPLPEDARVEALQRLAESLDPALASMVAYDAVVDQLNEGLREGIIDQVQYDHYLSLVEERLNGVASAGGGAAAAISEVTDAALESAEATAGAVSEIENLFDQAGRGMITGLGSWIKKGEYTISSFGQFLADQLGKIADMFLDAALKPIAGLFGNLFSNIGSGIFGGAGGISGARATGGDVFAGRSYNVGEFGKERFVPDVNGKIVSNNQLGEAPSVNLSFNVVSSDPKTQVFASSRRQSGRAARGLAGM